MSKRKFDRGWWLAVPALALMVSLAAADEHGALSFEPTGSDASALTARLVSQDDRAASDKTTVTTYEDGGEDDLSGPYFLRGATPVAPGEMELKLRYDFVRESDGEEHELEFILEWGLARDWEFIFELPVQIGDGRVDGNGDITTFGFQTRLWEESDWMPAFAVRNLIRIPTGYHSDGVDYTLRGLFTKTLVPDAWRLHFNPFVTSINGNRADNDRWFRWGAALGFDYAASDNLRFIADYFHQTSEEFGQSNRKSIELGVDWEFADDQTLSLATEINLDDFDDDFSIAVQYMMEIGAPRLDQ